MREGEQRRDCTLKKNHLIRLWDLVQSCTDISYTLGPFCVLEQHNWAWKKERMGKVCDNYISYHCSTRGEFPLFLAVSSSPAASRGAGGWSSPAQAACLHWQLLRVFQPPVPSPKQSRGWTGQRWACFAPVRENFGGRGWKTSEIRVLMGWGQCRLKYGRHGRKAGAGTCHSASADGASARQPRFLHLKHLNRLLGLKAATPETRMVVGWRAAVSGHWGTPL